MAPEIKERKIYDGKKADIFAIGVIIFTIIKGKLPFNDANKKDFQYNLL